MAVPVRHLRQELAPAKDDAGRTALDAPILEGLMAHVLPMLQQQEYTERRGAAPRSAVLDAAVTDFGVERCACTRQTAPSVGWPPPIHPRPCC